MELARLEVGTDGPYLVSGRQHGHDRLSPHRHLAHPCRAAGGDVDRAQAVACEQEELVGDDVLSDRAHVLVGGCLRAQLGGAVRETDMLTHHHGVKGIGEWVPSVDHLVAAGRKQDGRLLPGPGRVAGAHRDAVHGRGIEGGRGP